MELPNKLKTTESNINVWSVIYALICLLSLVATSFSASFIPERFLRDSVYISQRIQSSTSNWGDSFETLKDIYVFFGVNSLTPTVKIFQWTLCFVAFQLSIVVANLRFGTKQVAAVSVFYFGLIPFFGAVLSKEVLVVLLITILLLAVLTLQKTGLKFDGLHVTYFLVVFCLGMAVAIRPYYFLTGLVFLGISLIKKRVLRESATWIRVALIPVLSASLIVYIDYQISFLRNTIGYSLYQARNRINEGLALVANSKIEQRLNPDSLSDLILEFISIFRQFLLPFELFTSGIYGYAATTVSLVSVLALLYPSASRKLRQHPVGIFFLAYFTVALMFEPDLGSFVRHTFVYCLFLPLLSIRESSPSRSM